MTGKQETRARDDFDVFVRQTRRALRDVVREEGRMPPKVDVVSRGQNPRRLEVQSVSTWEYRPVERIGAFIRDWRAAYVGLIRLLPRVVPAQGVGESCPACGAEADDEELGSCDVCDGLGTLWRAVGLSAISVDRTARFSAGVHPVHGVGAWEPSEFRTGDVEPLRAVLFDVWSGAA
jgi:hypothetical protein